MKISKKILEPRIELGFATYKDAVITIKLLELTIYAV